MAVRRGLCRRLFKRAGRRINIETGAYFGDGRNVTIGDGSGIGKHCSLHGPVALGNDVMMGPEVLIMTRNHHFARTDIPMCQQGDTAPEPVVIEDDVWIGARAIILPGVTIGRGSIVAAGAVVTRSIEAYSIAGGNPAKLIKRRVQETVTNG